MSNQNETETTKSCECLNESCGCEQSGVCLCGTACECMTACECSGTGCTCGR